MRVCVCVYEYVQVCSSVQEHVEARGPCWDVFYNHISLDKKEISKTNFYDFSKLSSFP